MSDRELFLNHVQDAIEHLGAAYRLASKTSLSYVEDMVGDALDVLSEVHDDVVIKGW